MSSILILCLLAGSPESTFAACPNDQLRAGASAHLPDCRAYELVSPPDSNGREFLSVIGFLPYEMFPYELITPSGDNAVFMAYGSPLAEPPGGNGLSDVYEAVRTPEGWRTVRRLTPSGAEAIEFSPGGVSADHRYAFVHVRESSPAGGSLAADGRAGYLSNPDGSFELVGVGSLGTERMAQGRFISSGGRHVIFTTSGEECNLIGCPRKQLEPLAAPTGTAAVYDREADGPTRVVSLLPGDVPAGPGQAATYQGTSADGSDTAFTIDGDLYLRIDNSVTKTVTTADSTFAGIAKDGSRVFYVSGGSIFSFEVESGVTTQVNPGGTAELANISADGSRVYFLSTTALAGAAEEGKPNLYVWRAAGDQLSFVATVAEADLTGIPALNNWTSWTVTPERQLGQGPGGNSSRSTPDGSVLVFESKARLSDYDNQGHTEIYRYDDASGKVDCVSCNPSGSPATSDARLQALRELGLSGGAAAMVLHNVSADGSHVFFETSEPLVAEDVNAINDIYRWRQAGGVSEISLISSGRGVAYPPLLTGLGHVPDPNVMIGISSSGNDVLFIGLDRLVPSAGAGGAPAVYDARVNGGFPEAPVPQTCLNAVECRTTNREEPVFSKARSGAVTAGNIRAKRKRCRRIRHRRTNQGKQRARTERRKCVKRGRGATGR